METLEYYHSILWGYHEDGTNQAIIASKDGDSKESYADGSFAANEVVLKFQIYKDLLYVCIRNATSGNGRILRLDKINSGTTDTWTEVLTTSDIDSEPNLFLSFDDYIYIISTSEVWKYDGTTLTSVTSSMPTADNFYYAVTAGDLIYFVGKNSTNHIFYSYDGSTTFTSISSHTAIDFPYSYEPIGKKLLDYYKGSIYFFKKSTNNKLYEYDINSTITTELLDLGSNKITCIFIDRNIIYVCYTTSSNSINIQMHPLYDIEKLDVLVSGENKVKNSLIRVNADPIQYIKDAKLNKLPNYKEYPVMCALRGAINPVVKVMNRIEPYTDTVNPNLLIGKNIKDVIDKLCSMTDNFLMVDSENVAKVDKRDLVGYGNKFQTLTNDNNYGNQVIKQVNSFNNFSQNFRRVAIGWNNDVWSRDNNVEVAGVSTLHNFPTYELSSDLLNDPVAARNIALYILNKTFKSEMVELNLAFLYYLEVGDILGLDINYENYYISDDREWKVYKIIHDYENKGTIVNLIERFILEEREGI